MQESGFADAGGDVDDDVLAFRGAHLVVEFRHGVDRPRHGAAPEVAAAEVFEVLEAAAGFFGEVVEVDGRGEAEGAGGVVGCLAGGVGAAGARWAVRVGGAAGDGAGFDGVVVQPGPFLSYGGGPSGFGSRLLQVVALAFVRLDCGLGYSTSHYSHLVRDSPNVSPC